MRTNPTPLTIVGLISNTVALVLVGAVLYSDPLSCKSYLDRLCNSITQLAATDQVLMQDIIRQQGKPIYTLTNEWMDRGEWVQSVEEFANKSTLEYWIGVESIVRQTLAGKYVYSINLRVKQTWHSGPKYLYGNLSRAFKSGTLFPFTPFIEEDSRRLVFDAPSGRLP